MSRRWEPTASEAADWSPWAPGWLDYPGYTLDIHAPARVVAPLLHPARWREVAVSAVGGVYESVGAHDGDELGVLTELAMLPSQMLQLAGRMLSALDSVQFCERLRTRCGWHGTEYRVVYSLLESLDGRVVVDEGVLVVRPAPGGCQLLGTKRLEFGGRYAALSHVGLSRLMDGALRQYLRVELQRLAHRVEFELHHAAPGPRRGADGA